MDKPPPPREYYFVSDLHLGGDGQLQYCDYASEFIDFLRLLEAKGPATELILVGDTFGLWEVTALEGVAKLDAIIASHRAIFRQFKATGAKIRITLAVGNHDYDLACDPAFAAHLREYNLHVENKAAFTRSIGDRKIWIEHGQQTDGFNASRDYGNPHALPIGYFITQTIIGEACRFSAFGRGHWMKDIRSVRTTEIPAWLLSNYIYRELSMVMTCMVVTLGMLFTLGTGAALAAGLHMAGVADLSIFRESPFASWLGSAGSLLKAGLAIDALILTFLGLIALPLRAVLRDVVTGIRRFRTLARERCHYDPASPEPYLRRAREVFKQNQDVGIYVFGHTHDALLVREGDKVVLNTGTWLKILRRVPSWLPLLPAVYYPSFRLNYFQVTEEGSEVVIRYAEIAKTAPHELNWLQRLATWGRSLDPPRSIPRETRIELNAGNFPNARSAASLVEPELP